MSLGESKKGCQGKCGVNCCQKTGRNCCSKLETLTGELKMKREKDNQEKGNKQKKTVIKCPGCKEVLPHHPSSACAHNPHSMI